LRVDPSRRLDVLDGFSSSPVDELFVKVSGELDASGRESMMQRCTEGYAPVVTVDLSELTFLDCGGYRAFTAARITLEQHGRALVLVGAVGEPRRLLDLIALFDARTPACRHSLQRVTP